MDCFSEEYRDMFVTETGEPPAEANINDDREALPVRPCDDSERDEAESKPPGSSVSDINHLQTRRNEMRIGTWNVRGLCREGKIRNVVEEAKALHLDLLGVSETHLDGVGDLSIDGILVVGHIFEELD